jgi:adenine-specific DNA-methyltransferase
MDSHKGPHLSKKSGRQEPTLKTMKSRDLDLTKSILWHGDVEQFLERLPDKPAFDLIITSPPYNLGKEYERPEKLSDYLGKQKVIIGKLVRRLKPRGSLCWQVGNYIGKDRIVPLDFEYHKIFDALGLKLQNRIVWHFGHGLHSRRRFSGRYEVVLWYTKGARYKFNLDDVRIKSKYPGKKAYKGVKKGQYSSHPSGKNPEDVWSIPNVKGNHIEKSIHPCQFPVGLVERLVLALTKKNDLVFDPFCGVASAGVAALHHERRFVGCERLKRYALAGLKRLTRAARKNERFRPHDKPIYDHTKSKLSINPWLTESGSKKAQRGN